MYFLSQENVLKHKDYLKDAKLRFSVLEKSYPLIKGLDLRGIESLRILREVKNEAERLKGEIILHELYFDSFSDKFYKCEAARNSFGSEANFLYEIETCVMKSAECGFVVVFFDGKNRLNFRFGADLTDVLMKYTPLLSIDVWEHAYFSDFGFDRKRYLKNALSHLNFDKINDFCKIY